MKSRPVLITFSILSGLDILFGSAALGNLIGVDTLALCVLSTKAVQVGMSFYVQNSVVPVQDVAAYRTSDNEIVAGPAASETDGKPVDVTPSREETGQNVDPYMG
jgi:hypothetical protein